jgi:hypothetical protein
VQILLLFYVLYNVLSGFLQKIQGLLQEKALEIEKDILSIYFFHAHGHDDVLPYFEVVVVRRRWFWAG